MVAKKHVKALATFAESLGLVVSTAYRKGNHISVHLTRGDGVSTTMIVGSTPSDHRAHLNNQSFIKRFNRGAQL